MQTDMQDIDFSQYDELKCIMGYEEAVKYVNELRFSVIKDLNRICQEHAIKYFAFGKLLIYALTYGDFFDSGKMESFRLGMLRSDYEKLLHILKIEHLNNGLIAKTNLEELNLPKRSIVIGKEVEYYKAEYNKVNDDSDIFIIKRFAGIEIVPFDNVPDEYELQRFHFWKMRKLNVLLSKSIDAKLSLDSPERLLKRYVVGETKSKKKKNLIGKVFPENKLYNYIYRKATEFQNKTNTVAGVVPKKTKVISLKDLLPYKTCKFRDIDLYIPQNTSIWCPVFDEEVQLRTQSIQKLSLEILKEIDYACQKIGIGYFVCGGTMLGVMRHQGYIPWDDDIDIGMLREDYDKFLKYGQKYLRDDLFLQTRETDSEIPYLFSKVRANNSKYITNYNEHRHFHKGVCVDIFPFDNIPDGEEEQANFRAEVRKWEKLHNRFCNKQKPEAYFKKNREYSFYENIVHYINWLHRNLYFMVPLWLTQKLYLKHATKYNDRKDLEYVASFVPSYTFISRENLLPYKRMKFEDFEVSMLQKPDVFLTMQYGDYLQPPPEHKRLGHDLIDWSVTEGVKENYRK